MPEPDSGIRYGDQPKKKDGDDAANSGGWAAAKFLGLNTWWRQWANLGVVGVVSGLLVSLILITFPAQERLFLDELSRKRSEFREDLKDERELFRQQMIEQRVREEAHIERLSRGIEMNQQTITATLELVQETQRQITALTRELLRSQHDDPPPRSRESPE